MSKNEFGYYFIIIFFMAFSNVGSLIGGGMIIPIMMGMFRFDAKEAVALQNSTFIAGLARYIMQSRDSHPLKNGAGVLSDYGLSSTMLPGAVIGVTLGSLVSRILPGPVIIFLFIACACLTALVALRNFFKIRKTENAVVQVQQAIAPS